MFKHLIISYHQLVHQQYTTTLPFHHAATLSPSHQHNHVTIPPTQPHHHPSVRTTMPPCHHPTMPSSHHASMPPYHRTYHHVTIPSSHHIASNTYIPTTHASVQQQHRTLPTYTSHLHLCPPTLTHIPGFPDM